MRGRCFWITTSSIMLLVLCVPRTSAAQCVCNYQAACQAYHASPAVMIVKVTGASLVVTKVLSGSAEAIDWAIGGECGIQLEQGTEYLVYPTRYQGKLVVGACTRMLPLAKAQEDLKVIRSLATRNSEGSVFGYLITGGRQFGAPFEITLEGGGKQYTQSTDGGPWEFNGVRPGSYRLTIMLSENVILGRSVFLRARGCEDTGEVGTP